jgi:hypothetical protein
MTPADKAETRMRFVSIAAALFPGGLGRRKLEALMVGLAQSADRFLTRCFVGQTVSRTALLSVADRLWNHVHSAAETTALGQQSLAPASSSNPAGNKWQFRRPSSQYRESRERNRLNHVTCG